MSATHVCRALNCPRKVSKKFLMCCFHWAALPNWIREAVCMAYNPGQESGKKAISPDWVKASRDAIVYIAEKENIEFVDDFGQPIQEKTPETPPEPEGDGSAD